MALFWSSFQYPIMSVQSPQRFSFPTALGSVTLISSNLTSRESETSSISTFSNFDNPMVRRPQSCINTSAGSSMEADEVTSNIVFVKGLPKSTLEKSLLKAFSEFGEVSRGFAAFYAFQRISQESVWRGQLALDLCFKIVTDKKTGEYLGFGYVWFSSKENAQMAAEEMNGKFFEGKFIFVTIAKPGSCKPQVKSTTPFKF